MDILNAAVKMAPIINSLTLSDVAVAVCDTENYLEYVPGLTLDHGVRKGQPLVVGSLMHKCAKEGKRFIKEYDEELFGFPYIGIVEPVIVDNKLLGAIGLFESLAHKRVIMDLSTDIFSRMEEILSISQKVSSIAQELSSIGNTLIDKANTNDKAVRDTDEILGRMKSLAKKSGLLGLNAAIEASRAGEAGRGFTVVVQEIRSLSISSEESAGKVEEIVANIKSSSSEMSKETKRIGELVKEQSQSFALVAEAVEEATKALDNLIEKIDSFSKKE